MSTYRLDKLFSPRSVAVVGASPRETSPVRAVLRNLRAAGFEGSVSLVNPHYGEIEGIKAVKTIQELPQAPDLLVIATPPQSVPGIVAAAGEKGAATAVIITAGLGHAEGSLADACEKAARATGLRLVGPNCLGVLSSRAKLNASFAALPFLAGIAPPLGGVRTPIGVFVTSGSCFSWLHTHASDGIIHIESPVKRTFTLGDFFDLWSQPLSVGGDSHQLLLRMTVLVGLLGPPVVVDKTNFKCGSKPWAVPRPIGALSSHSALRPSWCLFCGCE